MNSVMRKAFRDVTQLEGIGAKYKTLSCTYGGIVPYVHDTRYMCWQIYRRLIHIIGIIRQCVSIRLTLICTIYMFM